MKAIAIISSQAFSLVNFRGSLIAALVTKDIRVYALAPDYSDEFRRQIVALGGIPVDFRLMRTGMNPLRDLLDMFKLASILRSLRPDVTLAYFAKPVIYGTLAAWMARIPRRVALIEGLGYVFTSAGRPLTGSRVLLRVAVSWLYRIALTRAHRAIFLNRDDITDFVKAGLVDEDKVDLLGGIGINLDEWQVAPAVKNPVTFLLAARLLREKGIFEYAAAARQVKASHPATRFILLGGADPNPGGLTQIEVQTWTHEGLLEWPGHVEVKPWLSQASVFVLPSYREGLPRSTQEAMAMGRPVITTNTPGCRETVQEGVNGYLVPVCDVPALVDAMLRFVETPSLIEPMGRESRRIAEANFDVNKINVRLVRILNGVMKPKSKAPATKNSRSVTISIVSHQQMDLVASLLLDLAKKCEKTKLKVILTLNVPEDISITLDQLPYPILLLKNIVPRGFGENHNRAFRRSKTNFFCVINPDIRIDSDIFPTLMEGLNDLSCGVIAPLIVDGKNSIEDSARKFPTPFKILCKATGRCRGSDYQVGINSLKPDWVGGMFMMFRRDTYAKLGGFDQKFYLYYEDVDLCARIRLMGLQVVMNPNVRATHLARRSSHSSVVYSLMHIRSMGRFFTSLVFAKVMFRRER